MACLGVLLRHGCLPLLTPEQFTCDRLENKSITYVIKCIPYFYFLLHCSAHPFHHLPIGCFQIIFSPSRCQVVALQNAHSTRLRTACWATLTPSLCLPCSLQCLHYTKQTLQSAETRRRQWQRCRRRTCCCLASCRATRAAYYCVSRRSKLPPSQSKETLLPPLPRLGIEHWKCLLQGPQR